MQWKLDKSKSFIKIDFYQDCTENFSQSIFLAEKISLFFEQFSILISLKKVRVLKNEINLKWYI